MSKLSSLTSLNQNDPLPMVLGEPKRVRIERDRKAYDELGKGLESQTLAFERANWDQHVQERVTDFTHHVSEVDMVLAKKIASNIVRAYDIIKARENNNLVLKNYYIDNHKDIIAEWRNAGHVLTTGTINQITGLVHAVHYQRVCTATPQELDAKAKNLAARGMTTPIYQTDESPFAEVSKPESWNDLKKELGLANVQNKDDAIIDVQSYLSRAYPDGYNQKITQLTSQDVQQEIHQKIGEIFHNASKSALASIKISELKSDNIEMDDSNTIAVPTADGEWKRISLSELSEMMHSKLIANMVANTTAPTINDVVSMAAVNTNSYNPHSNAS